MGEIAQMFLDGTMCQECGQFIDGGNQGPGYPITCDDCKNEASKPKRGRGTENEFIGKIQVMGIHAGDRRANIQKYVKQGSKFILTREPNNPYDENAILIELPVRGGAHKLDLGYVPRETAAEIASDIDNGIEYKLTFRTKIISEKTGKMISLYLNLIRVN